MRHRRSSTSVVRRATCSPGWPAGAAHVSVVGSAADDHPLPPAPPTRRRRLPLHGRDRRRPRRRRGIDGFTELELLKRATLAGIGTCQGGACLPARPGVDRAPGPATCRSPFTARPGARQITLAEAAADVDDRRLPADAAARRAPRARRADGPVRRLVAAVALRRRGRRVLGGPRGRLDRRRGTLGKLVVSGPGRRRGAGALYPCHVADIKPGRSRYALLLNERGHVMDDGMILRESETRFVLTFTSGGAANAEMWLRDWIDTWGLRVHVMDRTMSLAAINVTGPLAGELLQRAGLGRAAALPRPRPRRRRRRAVPRHAPVVHRRGGLRAAPPGRPVGRAVAGADGRSGADLGIRPHGLQALFGLRLEKGHVIVGMDTELDTTPRRLGMDWAARMDKPWFIGRAALERTAKLPDDAALGRLHDGRAGAGRGHADLRSDGEIVGNVTGSWTSPVLGKAADARLAAPAAARRPRSTIDGREAVVTPTPVLRPGGPPCSSLSRCAGHARRRRPAARSTRSRDALPARRRWLLRFAPDEALVIGVTSVDLDDPDAIVEDEAGFVGACTVERDVVERHTRVGAAGRRGRLGQGAIAGVPAKLLARRTVDAWVVAHAAYADELADRLR